MVLNGPVLLQVNGWNNLLSSYCPESYFLLLGGCLFWGNVSRNSGFLLRSIICLSCMLWGYNHSSWEEFLNVVTVLSGCRASHAGIGIITSIWFTVIETQAPDKSSIEYLKRLTSDNFPPPSPTHIFMEKNCFCSFLAKEGTVKIIVVEKVNIEVQFYLPLCFLFHSIFYFIPKWLGPTYGTASTRAITAWWKYWMGFHPGGRIRFSKPQY